jgi:predicted TIM-barrel fold metal-dependent hydrolase
VRDARSRTEIPVTGDATRHALPVIDCDSHITEPPDLWTSRMSARQQDYAPRVEIDSETARPRWVINGNLSMFATQLNHAGWREFHPSTPPSWEDADAAGWDPKLRLERMDEYGIYAQVLFPNIIAFDVHAFMQMPRLAALECVQAYNDFQVEWASADPHRLIPLMVLPFWDMGASLAEVRRCHDLGHRGINFGVEAHRLGLPHAHDDHWTPLYALAQDLGLSLSFHIGFNQRTKEDRAAMLETRKDALENAKRVALQFMSNASGVAEIIFGGICERFPRLKFVSIESGFGYLPFLLEVMDWQFTNTMAKDLRPGWLLPSEYFRRQIYASFWFETGIGRQVDLYPDNILFETDFPHPTGLSPGPGTHAPAPQQAIAVNLADLSEEHLRKVLYENAANVYHIEIPAA